MKNIVPGCLCLLIEGHNAGRTVKAIEYIGRSAASEHNKIIVENDLWKVEPLFECEEREYGYVARTSSLMRIDDYKPTLEDLEDVINEAKI